jgi:glucose 1-dehydrogenase
METAGKVAVVGGGGSGIGRAAVLALVNRGSKVVVADVNEDAGRQTVGIAAEEGSTAIFCRCDVTKTEDLTRILTPAVEPFGALHIAFNNAGIGGENLVRRRPGRLGAHH